MIFKNKWLYGITLVALSVGLPGLLTGCLCRRSEEATSDSDTNRPVEKIIFKIGQENKSYFEFNRNGFLQTTEYRCTVGVDCSTEAFPEYLTRAESGYLVYGVERIIISFRLDQTYDDITLRLARGGDETTLVRVDQNETYLVTNTMLGSGEGYRVGVYDLQVGRLEKGRHSIELTVADDGKGNAAYQWDALSLVARNDEEN